VTDHEFERLVRNVYKVLLTRGMIGTIIYSADPETREKPRSLIPVTSWPRAGDASPHGRSHDGEQAR
jgi:Uncharacterized conserved protein (DUF2075)